MQQIHYEPVRDDWNNKQHKIRQRLHIMDFSELGFMDISFHC